MTLELCRHPQSERQVERVEQYVSVMEVSNIELETTREALEQGADKASKDLERFYDGILPEILSSPLGPLPPVERAGPRVGKSLALPARSTRGYARSRLRGVLSSE